MNLQKIVLATRNQGKIAELAAPLATLGYDLLGLSAFPNIPGVNETGQTFAENAILKARTIADATGLVAIADDSGLMVDALAGQPGVYSARYADNLRPEEGETRDQRNMRKLLDAMRNVPTGKRNAHFTTVMAAYAPTGQHLITSGEWHGLILEAPIGENGFGYDPVFWDVDAEKSAAQMSREEKNAVSHRGKAVTAMLNAWPGFMEDIKTARKRP